MEQCIIDGKRCFECCKVLTIRTSKSFFEWMKYVRNHGYKNVNQDDLPSEHRIYHLLKKISKRRAKKINKHLVAKVKNKQSYFLCKNFTGSGCSDYSGRPLMCSEYPYYGKTKSEFLKYVKDTDNENGLYKDGCTYYLELK